MTAPSFRHDEAGTPEPTWLLDRRWDDCAELDVAGLAARYDRVVVLAAHPDDETLAVGGLIADLADRGVRITLACATDGEASHPDSPTWTPAMLVEQRRRELTEAVGVLAPEAELVAWGLPDGHLADHPDRLRELVDGVIDPDCLVLAPWSSDGHTDHEAMGRTATEAAAAVGCTVLQYPIWLWQWGVPDDVPWADVRVLSTPLADYDRKLEALTRFRTQVEPLSPLPEDGAILTATTLARASRLFETLIDASGREPGTKGHTAAEERRRSAFDAMYDSGPDPWRQAESFYEHRKFDLTLAALGRPRYGRALDIGCAGGTLTRRLTQRADAVVAVDTSTRALQEATIDRPANLELVHSDAVVDLPPGPFDLVVLSEVGYFLEPLELLSLLRAIRSRLADGGEFLLADWQQPTADIPLDGARVHEQVRAAMDLPPASSYVDDDVRIDVWSAAGSVAARESRG